MKRQLLLSIVIFLNMSFLFSQLQGPSISFEKDEHDFGKVQELGGKVTCEFPFMNTGSEPLILNSVKASCGCTTPEWSKEPILPGKKGFVRIAYDPENRPGTFVKTVTINSNAVENQNYVVRIKGDVVPRPKTIEQLYPSDLKEIRLKSNHIGFGKINFDEKSTLRLGFINVSKNPVKIEFTDVPPYLDIKSVPEIVQEGDTGSIIGVYDAKMKNDWGFVVDRINIVTNGKTDADKRITVSANIVEDFSKLTPQERQNAASIRFDTEVFDFGKMQQNEKVEYDFKFTNTGKSDLIIRKVTSTCGCTVASPQNSNVKPGEQSSLHAVFSSGNRTGMQSKIITIITNDPVNNIVRLYVKGEVEAPVK